MGITKQKLREIIKESIEEVVNEQSEPDLSEMKRDIDELQKQVDRGWSTRGQIREEIRKVNVKINELEERLEERGIDITTPTKKQAHWAKRDAEEKARRER